MQKSAYNIKPDLSPADIKVGMKVWFVGYKKGNANDFQPWPVIVLEKKAKNKWIVGFPCKPDAPEGEQLPVQW